MTLYASLGLLPNATPAEVRRAFEARSAALAARRDAACSPAERARVVVEQRAIQAAWDILGHPPRRRAYDRQLEAHQPAITFHPGPPLVLLAALAVLLLLQFTAADVLPIALTSALLATLLWANPHTEEPR